MALSLLAANNAQTVLAAGISSTATSLTVNAGTGTLFPPPVAGTSFFKLTIIDAATGSLTEIVHVTARAGDVFTIQRGQEGTVPRAWSANDIVANMMTAGTLSYILGNFQPLDPTLTALAALVGVANKLPYFNGYDTAALTDLTQVGRDIIGKRTISDILTYLRLSDSAGFVGRLIGPPKIFTSSGTYTPTPGTKKILIEVQGAGSGGGGAGSTSATSYSAGGNGTGGGYAMSLLDVAADKITSVPVTVGAGGLGGSGAPTGGNVGGASKFGSFITAGGGNGSLTTVPRDTAFTITGTYGGIATGGNIINRQGDGSDSVICIGGLIVIGRAGSSKFGAGGSGYAIWNVPGGNGVGYGSGGTGATSKNSPDAFYSGGNGADGIVIVWELA